MPTQYELMVRLLLAAIFGAAVGLERKAHLKDAGLRTHFAVAVGGAIFMIVSKYAFGDMVSGRAISLDPSRIAAQVASGIGFLGAGTIMVQRNSVRGLTTAAGLWTTAGIGLATGAGLYVIAASGTALVICGFMFLKWLERTLVGTIDQITITAHNTMDILPRLSAALADIHVTVERMEIDKMGRESITIGLYVRLTNRAVTQSEIAHAVTSLPDIEQVRFGGQN